MPTAATSVSAAPLDELTDEDIQKTLAGESLRGPRRFRGLELAAYSPGLRDLVIKVVSPQDTAVLHDVTVVYVLGRAHAPTEELRRLHRRELIAESDDREGFRAKVSVDFMDTLSEVEIAEASAIVTALLTPVRQAEVAIAGPLGKKKAVAPAKPSRMKARS